MTAVRYIVAIGLGLATVQPAVAKPRPPAAPTPLLVKAETKFDATVALPGLAAGLAVFVRGESLWLVGAGDDKAAVPKLSGANQKDLSGGERLTVPGATVFKLHVPQGVIPSVTRVGSAWQIALSRDPAKSLPTADASLSDETGRTNFAVSVAGAAKPVAIVDSETGDTLLAVPSPPGSAYGGERRFAEFELLPAAQGVVVRPLADGVAVTNDADKIMIAMPKGLKLSDPADRPVFATPLAKAEPAVAATRKNDRVLLDWSAWHLPADKPEDVRRELEHRAALAPVKERASLFLDLARTVFANGHAPETLGYLDLALESDTDLGARDDVRMLRAAALSLFGHAQQADADLDKAGITETGDAALWRGLNAARAGRWAEADKYFHGTLARMPAYPDGLFRPLALAAIEAALDNQDIADAKRLMEDLRHHPLPEATMPAIDYLEGRIAEAEGNKDAALAAWDKATHSRDQYYRTRSELASVQAGLAAKTLEPKIAVERLDRLRFAWRGDDFENKVLGLLGATALEAEDYETAQATFRQIIALTGPGPVVEDARKNLASIFHTLFIDGAADKLPPLRTLALFNAMRDLAPSGPDGDKALDRLSERMVQMDLLSQAAEIIEGQAQHQADAGAKAQMGARAAALRLLDEKPELALRVLDETEADATAADVKSNRRLLRTRALSKQGRIDEALKLLGDDPAAAADALRADIGWAGQHWKVAADALARLAGSPPASGHMDEAKAGIVLRRALALNLMQDSGSLAVLRRDFAPCLEGTKAAAPFEVLTRPQGEGGLANVGIIRSAIAEVDLFKDFLASYRTAGADAAAPKS